MQTPAPLRWYVALQYAVLVPFVSHFIGVAKGLDRGTAAVYALGILVTAVALGALLERFVWGKWLEQVRLLALGVTTLQRSPLLPDVPTVAEAGVPGYELDVWFGMLASRKTPRPIIKLLNAEVARVLALPDIRERMLKNGIVPKPSTPEAFDAFVRTEVTKLGKVIKAAGAQIE